MKEKIVQKQHVLQQTPYIRREQSFDLDVMKLDKIISIVWPRRSGKTTYMLQIIDTLIQGVLLTWSQVVYIDFNDHIWGEYDFEDLLRSYMNIYPEQQPMFFFDEIQEVENMRSGVFFLHNLWYQVFMTGSNSKILSSELSTHFRGKNYEIQITPLDFREYCRFRNISPERKSYIQQGSLHKHFLEFMTRWGYPEIVLSHSNTFLQKKLLKTYMDIMIYKDLMERYNINDEYALKFMIMKLISAHTKQINISKLNNELASKGRSKNKNLLYHILDHLTSVFFVDTLQQQYKKQWFRKVYLLDNSYQTITLQGENYGQKFENVIYRYLKKKNDHISFISSTQYEIDFIDDHGIRYQVCWEWNDENNLRETWHLWPKDIFIYGTDYRSQKHETSFKAFPYYEFLLEK